MKLSIMADLENDDFNERGTAAVAVMLERWLAEYKGNAGYTIEADRWTLRDANGNTVGTVHIWDDSKKEEVHA